MLWPRLHVRAHRDGPRGRVHPPHHEGDRQLGRAAMSAASRVGFSWHRWWAMVKKEFLQLRRDRITFGMIVGIPIVQLTLFGYAINTDPKHLPTGVIAADHSEF